MYVLDALEHNIIRTEPLRGSELRLFISYIKPNKVVSSSTISRWLKNFLTLSGIGVSKYNPITSVVSQLLKPKLLVSPLKKL